MIKCIKLDFMICPDEMKKCYVSNPVRIRIIDPKSIFLTGILGESGRKMIKQGCEFYFTARLANKLIKIGVAIRVSKNVMESFKK